MDRRFLERERLLRDRRIKLESFVVGFLPFSFRLRMLVSTVQSMKCFASVKLNPLKTLSRTLFNPFASKPIEQAKDSHSNSLADVENVFELQHHTIRPSSMVNAFLFHETKVSRGFLSDRVNRTNKTSLSREHSEFVNLKTEAKKLARSVSIASDFARERKTQPAVRYD